MKKILRNVTLTAAALVAALAAAPKSEADVRIGFGFHAGPRAVYAPYYPYGPHRYVAPFRVFHGVRFYSYYPGPGSVYIVDGGYTGWVLPPFAGAVWVPGYYDRFGFWVGGHWRI